MKEEAFKSQPGRRFSALVRRLGVVMLMFLTSTIETDLVEHAEASSVKLVHEKDLDIGGGFKAFAWSPDSKFIAFLRSERGVAGIVDLETGKLTEIPDSRLGGTSGIAWSQDAGYLAVGSDLEFKVIRISDLKVIRHFEGRDRVNFADAIAFSKNGDSLLLSSKLKSPLLYRFDLNTNNLEGFVKSPFGERETAPWHGRLRWLNDRLYFAVEIDRMDEELEPAFPDEPNGLKLRVPHPSYYVFDLGEGTKISSTHSVDVNKWIRPGYRPFAPSHYGLVAGAASVVGIQSGVSEGEAAATKPSGTALLFRVFDLANGKPTGAFDSVPLGKARSTQFDLHPVEPWIVTVVSEKFSPTSELEMWNIRSGEKLTQAIGPAYLRDPLISPDGERLAFWSPTNAIPIFKLQQN
jgi:hypothetical protein